MDALDGNAIAGILVAAFGTEMTTAATTCATCGASCVMGELPVYTRAPGAVIRCSRCDAVLMVLVETRGVVCVDVSGLAALEPSN